ncbi:MAG TPA: hypothetical protein VMU84_12570, partial [Thermoanaerobaculia bacterium]|nr:hypothetical protein [Thermoanaerobaculia bacterium]
RWAHSFERDSGSSDPLFPKELAIKDTPVDLGMGLPAVMGNPIGSGKQDYKLDHFADLRVRKGADFGQPVGDGQPTTLDVHYSDDIRLNLMSYWYSQQYAMRYSKNQVARMQHAVDTFRSNLVLRTTTVTVTVHDDHLEVTESLFAKPPLLRLEPERVMIQIRKPTRRQIDTSIARFRRQRRAVHVGHCALTIPAR